MSQQLGSRAGIISAAQSFAELLEFGPGDLVVGMVGTELARISSNYLG